MVMLIEDYNFAICPAIVVTPSRLDQRALFIKPNINIKARNESNNHFPYSRQKLGNQSPPLPPPPPFGHFLRKDSEK